jgi:exodeoxyribonuclease VII large subunit
VLEAGHCLLRVSERLRHATTSRLQTAQLHLDAQAQRIAALDPALQIKRGYSLTYTPDGRLVRSVGTIVAGQEIVTRLSDGTLASVVK